MKRIGVLYSYELKKIVNRKLVWIVGTIIVLLCGFLSFSDLIGSTYYFEDKDVSGYEAMKINREYARNLNRRKIDDSLLQEMQASFPKETDGKIISNNSMSGIQTAIVTDDSQGDELERGITEYTPIYSYVQAIMENSNSALEIDANDLYSEREKSISQNHTVQMLTEKETDYWEKKAAQIKTPFTYEYTEGWGDLWEYAYTINYMVLLVLAICLSNVFSVEHLRKTDAIILCSRHGRRDLYIAKILAGMTFGVVIAVLCFGITAISSICIYGADGFNVAVQLAFPLSSWNITVGESVLILLIELVIISILYSITIMVLSEILKNSIAVMAIPVGIMIFTMMIDIPYQFRVPSQIYDLLPTNLLIKWNLWDDRLVSIFGKYLINFQIAPIIYLIITIILFFVGKKVYLKYQIGAR
ncbi:ABC transporter permease subunit [Extibacter muris]|uniref:ABC transporter permease n=1 Tax=Extibacter muris TaxID=1796622 RepID=A0A4R4FBW6_9FIRM|nr:ABC transporter permease subunit [Extibacter muris]MCU0080982.1 ABC transporter permease subunit [Extibacter muris]TDA20189.1 hypothetical protein E1963_18305 [Extibacter muris]